jgi:hypothetical protein
MDSTTIALYDKSTEWVYLFVYCRGSRKLKCPRVSLSKRGDVSAVRSDIHPLGLIAMYLMRTNVEVT